MSMNGQLFFDALIIMAIGMLAAVAILSFLVYVGRTYELGSNISTNNIQGWINSSIYPYREFKLQIG